MGNSLSIWNSEDRRDHIRNQVSKLGDRYPFGDKELLQLARCHAYLEYTGSSTTNSFLSAWGTYCSSLPSPDWSNSSSYHDILQVDTAIVQQQGHQQQSKWKVHRERILLDIVEGKLLPDGFGVTLENALYLCSNDTSKWNNKNDNNTIQKEYHIHPKDNTIMPIDESNAMMKFDKFLEGASNCTRRGGRQSLTSLFHCCCSVVVGVDPPMANAKDLLHLAYRISLATAYLTSPETLMPQDFQPEETGGENIMLTSSLLAYAQNSASITDHFGASPLFFQTQQQQQKQQAVTNKDLSKEEQTQMVTLQQFIEWSEQYTPCLSSVLPTFFQYIFFPNVPYPPSRTPFIYPDLKNVHSAFFPSRNSSRLFALGAMSPSLGGEWHRLFTSDDDGLSFNRLQNALLGYSGPTLILIKEIGQGGIFGAFTASPWKESKDFYGNSDCFLFRLTPSVAIYRPRGAGTNYMYCNSKARSKGYDGQAHGIGFGGTVDQPRLFISETFEGCMAATGDMTFKAGSLLPPPPTPDTPPTKFFDIESVEVWGVGGSDIVAEALGSRDKQREIAAANIQKARKVDKAQFLDDFNSGLIFSKAFAHKQQVAGRVDVCVSDNEDENDDTNGKK